MSSTIEMNSCKKYAESILKKISEFNSIIRDQPYREDKIFNEINRLVEANHKKARDLKEATLKEVKIAVMGEFNATKTTILGSLLGYVGILPESEVATTGNITQIHIVPVKNSQATEFKFAVEYFNLDDVNECLDYMLKQLSKKILDVKLPEAQISSFRSLFSSNEKLNEKLWENIIIWCKETIKLNITPGLRLSINELEVFAESYKRYGKFVCGTSSDIDIDTVCSGLQLPPEPMDILKLKFEKLPPDKQYFPEFLQATFPLIRRVNVQVKLSNKIWNLSSFQETHSFVLLDFPGLGAGKSELRDQFLAIREMKNVQTILLLLDSTRPGSAKNYEIFDLLRQQRPNEDIDDFIIVGIGRFDYLPNAEVCIDEIINDNEFLTDEHVYKKIPALRDAIKSARNSTNEKDNRIVLLSAYAALEYRRKNLDSTIEIATPKTLEKMKEFQNDFPHLCEKWKLLSKKLKQHNPDSFLVILLDNFTTDGGINRLKDVLEKHVSDHGLNQLYKDVKSKTKNLCDQQNQLKQSLSDPSMRDFLELEEHNLYPLCQVVQKLADSYKILKNYLEKNQFELGIGIDKKENNITLEQEIRDQVTNSIFSWTQWRELINQVQTQDWRIKISVRIQVFIAGMSEGIGFRLSDAIAIKACWKNSSAERPCALQV